MPPNNDLEKRLWAAEDQLRANSSLTAQEYSRPVLGLIFLRYADHRFTAVEKRSAQNLGGHWCMLCQGIENGGEYTHLLVADCQ